MATVQFQLPIGGYPSCVPDWDEFPPAEVEVRTDRVGGSVCIYTMRTAVRTE